MTLPPTVCREFSTPLEMTTMDAKMIDTVRRHFAGTPAEAHYVEVMTKVSAATLPERIEAIVRAWPQWSRAEREKLDTILGEILDHCANGTGNSFIRQWCRLNVAHLFGGAV